ncbi:MAG: sigma-70 family RNA polymerase sigma factor [Bacteroidales bacterium]|nr:sigma-70 family RNA polymerase sigma factor [Bacteroidales bacterium]
MTEINRFEVKNFKSWLHVVVKNSCLMHLRSEKQVKVYTENLLKEENDMEFETLLHPTDEKYSEVDFEQLEKAVESLDDEQKKCIELFYMQDKSNKDIVDITGFTMNQVKSNIQNGKRNLKNFLLMNGKFILLILQWFI